MTKDSAHSKEDFHSHEKELVIPALEIDIRYKPSRTNRNLRAIVITKNPKKFEEFRSQLGDGYGMDLVQYIPDNNIDFTNEQSMMDLCVTLFQNQAISPHFILREETFLISQNNYRNLTKLSLAELTELELENVLHLSVLKSYKPKWDVQDLNSFTHDGSKKLLGFTVKQHEKRSYGYIKPKNHQSSSCQYGFGWDALFVNSTTNLTNEEFFIKFGKKISTSTYD